MSYQPGQREQEPQRRTGGPIGGLIKLVGTGVGAAVEYHGHRKQRKAARDSAQTSPMEEPVVAGPSSQPAAYQHSATASDTSPPPYYQSTNMGQQQDRQLASGPLASEDKKGSIDSDTDSSDYISDELTPLEEDEEAWQLDEIAASTEPPSYEEASTNPREDAETLFRDLASRHHNASLTDNPNPEPLPPLPLPVIIPQRRPRNKSRGFVRAYSPVLQTVGIDQATFLHFLKTFHSSSQANPLFTAVTVAAQIAGFVPDPIVMAVTISVQVAAGIGKEIDSRRKTNGFLDRVNEELFKPAGCFAFIMKYKSDAEVASSQAASGKKGLLARLGIGAAEVDFSASKAIAKYESSSSSVPGSDGGSNHGGKFSAQMKKIRLASGETRGSAKIVEAAPLIYPEIDEVLYSGKDGEETFKDKTRDAKKFLAGYVDRRAQLKYVSIHCPLSPSPNGPQLTSTSQAQNDPTSALRVPTSEPANRSKWSDPNHPMFNGGLIGLVSGGHIDAGKHRAEKRERKLERKDRRFERRHRDGDGSHRGTLPRASLGAGSGRGGGFARSEDQGPEEDFGRGDPSRAAHPRGRRAAGGKGGVVGAVKKVMQEDVLYLMIVPMPSEAELAEARKMLAREKERD